MVELRILVKGSSQGYSPKYCTCSVRTSFDIVSTSSPCSSTSEFSGWTLDFRKLMKIIITGIREAANNTPPVM